MIQINPTDKPALKKIEEFEGQFQTFSDGLEKTDMNELRSQEFENDET